MKIRRIICLLVALTMVLSMTTVTADAASFTSKPTGVKAKCVSGAAVTVSCKAKAGATGYNFYYNTKKGGHYTLGATSASRSATITGLTAGKKYYFKVQAYQDGDTRIYSKMSKAAKCKTVLKKPSATVTDKCGCKVCFRLNCNDGTKGFIIYRSTKKKKGYKKIKTVSGGPSTPWTDRSVRGSTTYYYKIKAYSGKYKTKYSSIVKVTTDAWHPDGNDASFDPVYSGKSAYAADFANHNIFFLGSSITYGSATGGVAFPDYIAARCNLKNFCCVNGDGSGRRTPGADSGIVWKEAVSGTTLARLSSGSNDSSYSCRLHQNYKNTTINPDIFACQLSLNDANRSVRVGSYTPIDYDRLQDEDQAEEYLEELYSKAYTVAGAIEYITAFAQAKWPGCQVVFYTITYFDGGYSGKYIDMINLLNAEKGNNIKVIGLWNNTALAPLSGNKLCMYMADSHHPKKAGYQQWAPVFERELSAWLPPVPSYAVAWVDENGDELVPSQDVIRGTKPSYGADNPTKADDNDNTYEFAGWAVVDNPSDAVSSEDVVNLGSLRVFGPLTFKAVFNAIPKEQPVPGEQGNDNNLNAPADPSLNGPDQNDLDDESNGEPGNVPDITSMIQTLLRAA